ncbi:uncharacterized protein LOC144104576 [Amblyomma americanum]
MWFLEPCAKLCFTLCPLSHFSAEVDSDVPTPPLCCQTCNGAFTTQTLLDEHQQREHTLGPQGKYCCTYCPYSSDSKAYHAKHEMTHTGKRRFVCKISQKGFKLSCDLRRHLLVHTGDKPHECNDCGRCFTDSSNMMRHRKIVHSDDGGVAPSCPHCGVGFTQLSNLKKHLLRHTGAWPHVCSQCSLVFRDISKPKRHENATHDLSHSLKCPRCGKNLATVCSLRRHMRNFHSTTRKDNMQDSH